MFCLLCNQYFFEFKAHQYSPVQLAYVINFMSGENVLVVAFLA